MPRRRAANATARYIAPVSRYSSPSRRATASPDGALAGPGRAVDGDDDGALTRTCRAGGPRRSRRRSARRRRPARGARRWSPAPAYVHAERTPATIWSRMSSTPGRSGSRYIRDVLMPSSNSSLRARSKALVVLRAVLDGAVGRHPEALLVEPPVGVAQRVGGRLVRAGEPRAEHHAGRAAGEGEGDVARPAHAAVGPDVLAEPAAPRRRTRRRPRTAGGRRRSSSASCTSRRARRRP